MLENLSVETLKKEKRNSRRVKVGKVVSDKMSKSIVVAVTYFIKHKLYKKTLTRTMRLMTHDEKNECSIGDTVKIMETRPLSKNKRWRFVQLISKGK